MKHTADPTPANLLMGDRYGAVPIVNPVLPPLLPRWRHELFDVFKTFIWFTILPVNKAMNATVPNSHFPNYEIRAEQYLYLPLVGITCVLATFLGAHLVAWAGVDPLLAALMAGFCYHLIYGHIHLEGLSDTVDALHAYPRKDPLTVMTEPHTGALGARYSGTANNLTSILISCLIILDSKHGSYLGMLGAAMIAAMVRIMPIYIVLRYYEGFHPGGAASIGANTTAVKARLRDFASTTLAAALLPTVAVCVYYHDLRGSVLYATAVIAFFTAVYSVKRVMNYLKIVYGDILGAGIICGEIAGFAILAIVLARSL
jgi:cobalamin synthase